MSASSGGGWSEVTTGVQPTTIQLPGGYELRDTLGAGGMGEVVRAFDPRLHREVAMKRVKQTAQSPELRARLLREARITATLNHPGIVPVLDVGELDDGRLFYTMRLIAGRTLDQVGDLPLARRLRHVLDAVQAVAYAHANDVIHRDLKPQNILVGAFGETLVVDWGLARRLHQTIEPVAAQGLPSDATEPDSHSELTRLGAVLGTEQWMSPEQARGEQLGPTADVYALGAVLVEVITGGRGDWVVLAGQIEDARLQAIAWRCLSEHPVDRYPTAGALAEDLAAWLDGDRVSAYRYTWRDELSSWIDRHRNALTGLSLAVVAGAVGLSVAGALALQERARAIEAEADAVEQRDRANAQLARSMAREAVQSLADGDWGTARLLAASSLSLGEDPRARGVWMADSGMVLELQPVEPGCPDAVPDRNGWVCPDRSLGTSYAVSAGSGETWVVDRARLALLDIHGQELQRFPDPHIGTLSATAGAVGLVTGGTLQMLTRDGEAYSQKVCDDASAHHPSHMTEDRTLLFACRNGRFGRFDGEAVRMQPIPDAPDDIFDLASTDSHVFMAAKDRYEARHAGDLSLDFAFPVSAGAPQRIEVDPTGRWALLHAAAPGAVLYDLDRRREAWRLPATWSAALSPDDRLRLVTDRGPAELDIASLRTPGVGHHNLGLADVAVSPDGERVALARGDGVVTVWRGGLLQATLPHPGPEPSVARSMAWGDSGLLVSRMWTSRALYVEQDDGGFLHRPLPGGGCRRLLWHATGPACFGFTHLGAVFDYTRDAGLGASKDGSGTRAPGRPVLDWLSEVGEDGSVVRYGPDGIPHHEFTVPGAQFVAITADGSQLALVVDDTVHVFTADGASLFDIDTSTPLEDVAWSVDGRWLAAGAADGRTFVWTADGHLRAELTLHTDQVSTVVFTEDALWTGSWDGFAYRWPLSRLDDTPDPPQVAERWALPPPGSGVTAVDGPVRRTEPRAPRATAP